MIRFFFFLFDESILVDQAPTLLKRGLWLRAKKKKKGPSLIGQKMIAELENIEQDKPLVDDNKIPKRNIDEHRTIPVVDIEKHSHRVAPSIQVFICVIFDTLSNNLIL